MKRIFLFLPTLVLSIFAALAPLSVTVSTSGAVASLNTAAAASSVTENVFCKDGITSGYTNDPVAFCKNAGGPANVSNNTRPYACVDKTVQYGVDAATACAGKHGGGAVATQNAADAAAAAPCPSNQVALSVAIKPGEHCIPNDRPGGAIVYYLTALLLYLSGLVGAVIVLMIVIGGVQYIVSTGDPTQVKNARQRIINAVTALVLFLASFAILNTIIPGGIL